jgi:outer membrane receptor protein involved in Fe transport
MGKQTERSIRRYLESTALCAASIVAAPAMAQQVPAAAELPPSAADAPADTATDVVVTGSRIRRSRADQPAPVVEIGQQAIIDRGYTSAAEALNDLTSITPAINQADGTGNSSGTGQQFPNLFGLGAGRTLTLVNGRRMVTSSSGLGDAQVDANIIPLGLLDRVEVVQAGGAAVYGSDAIAGVVNYVLKKDFKGLEVDAQSGISSRGDYPTYSARATAGTNFADGRGNVAVDVSWATSPTLAFGARPLSNLSRVTVSNAADTGPSDGVPSVKELLDAHFWEFNPNGVLFNTPAPLTRFLTGGGLQFAPDGSVVPYNAGTSVGIPFASGGDGLRYSDLAGLRTGVDRLTANLIGHYDVSDHLTISTELLYARTKGTEIPQGNSFTILNAGTYAGPIAFTINNPYLTTAAKATLSAARPAFAAGAPIFLSKYFYDLVPSDQQTTTTNTYRALLSANGDFDVGARNFYWSVSGSYARVEGAQRSWQVINSNFQNAIDATRNGAGQIVCAINADATTANDDPNCAPINPFGNGNVSAAARNYVSTIAGMDYTNEQVDVLATLGGTIVRLPMGDVKFSLAYEHRDERARFDPLAANQAGVFGGGTLEVPQSGRYNTNEFSAELDIPLIGKDFTLPLVKELEAIGAYRYVDNSIAGSQSVWEGGLRWLVTDGVTLRGTRSRNFRAPTLTQLFQPSSTSLGGSGFDPCDADRINSGPNPGVRRANCLATFAANPGYGVDGDGTGAGLSAAQRLARFQDPAENFDRATITTGGNAGLRNEISNTLSYGITLQPTFVRGLTITADRIQIDLRDGLSAFTTEDFTAACYDNANPDPAVCNAFSRLAVSDGTSPGGTIVTGSTTTFNAGVVKYRGETYAIDYRFAPGDLFAGGRDLGMLQLNAAATHNQLLTQSVTGETFDRTDDTITEPSWVGRFNATYTKGPIRLSYQLFYMPAARRTYTSTIENDPVPEVASNMTHSLSAQVDVGRMTYRIGVENLTDEQPSYPSIAYGDILGRRFFAGVNVKLP